MNESYYAINRKWKLYKMKAIQCKVTFNLEKSRQYKLDGVFHDIWT